MQSMTGYGRGRACHDGREMVVELKSVNHRYLDLSFRLPKNLGMVEDTLRTTIQKSQVNRGHVDIFVTYQNTREDARTLEVDEQLLGSFRNAVRNAGELLADYRSATVGEVLTLSGALTVSQADEDAEALKSLAAEAMGQALAALVEMRTQEGDNLRADLRSHLSQVAALREKIAQRAPSVPQEYRRRLEARLSEWQVEGVDPQRIAQEVAIMADRCAIDEELSRLESHIAQFESILATEPQPGKKLDFLLQEMNREVNTIGSKASDAEIAKAVVDAKCTLEKLREQVQNVA
ncbi:MAG: YicC family protein [Clostridiales bacterium]|nr:YicC family protein [Clostridiales bacterium]